MADENCNTYQISSELAASLRVPPIKYPKGIVPRATIALCVPPIILNKYPQLRADTPLTSVLTLLH
jgi:hypothetical protein